MLTHTGTLTLTLTLFALRPRPPQSPPPPPPPPHAPLVTVAGGCNFETGDVRFGGALDYVLQGTTASGAPYYKADSASVWLYWDPDCYGLTVPGGGGQHAAVITCARVFCDVTLQKEFSNLI